jgi:hypothetical protein
MEGKIMLKPMPKQEYLADLQARNRRNREVVETTFVPLNEAQRSTQPAPGEWSVDQCFKHLVTSFENFAPNTTAALNRPERPNSDGIFRPSWLTSKTLPATFEPKRNIRTLPRFNPTTSSHPKILTRWLAQNDRLTMMIEQAARADLQAKCWYFQGLYRFRLGEFLYFFVAHDELHIDQAWRALAVYEQRVAV